MRRGEVDSGEIWLRRAADIGSVMGMFELVALLEARGELAEAEKWINQIDAEGYPREAAVESLRQPRWGRAHI